MTLVCGPPKYSELRINISQAFNGIGTVIAPVLGSYVFFNFSDEKALQNVQWVYLAIVVFVLLLATLFFLANIPEITNAGKYFCCNGHSRLSLLMTNSLLDMEFQAQEAHGSSDDKPIWKQYRLFHAALAQFAYTGAQVAIASGFINYAVYTRPGTSSSLGSKLFAGAQAAFAIGRFSGSGIMRFVKPRWVFFVFISLCIVFICPATTQKGDTGIAMLYVVLFFESVCFPTIVALGMKGLGRHTKRGSGFIVGGVVGGACIPPLTFVAAERQGNGISMVVPLAFFVVAWSYAFCVNFVPAYRDVVDAFSETEVGTQGHTHDEEIAEKVDHEKPMATNVQ